ncbi:hypothetical protein BDF21DRAFT_487285 [Thamnidium elegans]|nr:hypothetical protein BDF21DRAFT_487285 [Thamnidium elegans]
MMILLHLIVRLSELLLLDFIANSVVTMSPLMFSRAVFSPKNDTYYDNCNKSLPKSLNDRIKNVCLRNHGVTKKQNVALFSERNYTGLNVFLLSGRLWLGTDLINKLILRLPSVLISHQWPSGQCFDVLFAPPKATTVRPPIIVEEQKIVNVKFIQRVIGHCLATNKEHNTLPIVLVFGINPTSTSVINDLIPRNKIPYTKEFYLLDPSTIENHFNKQPLRPLVVVEYFLHE